MTPAELKAQLQTRHEECSALRELWNSLMPDVCPDDRQFLLWLNLHPFDRVVYSVKRTASKHAKLGDTMTLEHAVRFCSKVANVRKTEQEEKTA